MAIYSSLQFKALKILIKILLRIWDNEIKGDSGCKKNCRTLMHHDKESMTCIAVDQGFEPTTF